MLYAIPVLDSASYRFDGYYRLAFHEIDRAASTHFVFQRIGNPDHSGRVHKSMRSQELVRQDARDAKRWLRDVRGSADEDSIRMEQMETATEIFHLSSDDKPCFVFLPETGTEPVGILHVAPCWYVSDSSWRVFIRCLLDWLQRDDVRRLATAVMSRVDLNRRLGELLSELTREINSQVDMGAPDARGSDSLGVKAAPAPRSGMVDFEAPANATWADVTIRFRDGHTVSVEVLGKKGRFNFAEMGMADRRTSNPDSQWRLLEVLSQRNGCLTWDHSQASRRNPKRVERLSERLRMFFRIKGKPIRLLGDKSGWQARFTLLPDA